MPKGKELERLCQECFMKHYRLSAKELQLLLSEQGVRVSLVSLYSLLRGLVGNDILIKQHSKYMLNLSWLLATSQRLRELADDIISGTHGAYAFRLEEIKRTKVPQAWRLSSLVEMNDLWVQLLIVLLHGSSTRIAHELIPHIWYAYLPSRRDEHFQRSFRDLASDIRVCVQGRSPLDREPLKGRQASYRKGHASRLRIPGDGTRYFACVDDWFMEVRIPKFLAEQIAAIFRNARTDDLDFRQKLNRALGAKAACRLYLSFKPQRAARLRGIVDKHM
jgi:hypothetical protein